MANTGCFSKSSSMSIRLSNRLLERIDRFITWFKKEYPGMSIGRPDVIRMAVERLTNKPSSTLNFLDALEKDLSNDKSLTHFYSNAEIKEFDDEDKIPLSLVKKAKKALSKQ